ncbi:hypothetical protein PAAG_03150 [Paracoccidioides lutzii Pb01]|uniref:DNA mismatch repair protein S5 domain-containing protein n=1 Tax=Paracoccidioides lutzii (strain ATCC MYA-826 / Pb01) TaxID=502779 RepID=C1GYJ6_PARBA|nr:hypothetical protein PAAG_03150 [Paracoccidioides lutzii Pb01]EEH41587.2 hypothetical protein PAAG_03150 [Paracoccidioides lutzii Pb01]
MVISALHQDTARAVRSAQVLSGPYSVVKELVDNGLDARATSISVELSANTVGIIQVRDNGTGIHPNDRQLVCKRSCTSKLRTVDDLRNVGGSTLGFRGEALASVAEMCGGILVTTKTDEELVGTALRYDRAGLLISCTKSSHPTGTTVRVSEFLKFVPVRKQTALKCASKTISRLKKMLIAYALSRPEIRLSLQVLGGKNQSPWIYAPKKTISGAVVAAVGPEVISQCIIVAWPESQDGEANSSSGHKDDSETNPLSIRLVAVVPGPDADCSKLTRAGQFVSIDRRPMSTSHGIAKEIVKLFKCYLRSGSLCNMDLTSPVDPFLFIHLQYPLGSYDANVEPSKDDVLFAASKLVMSLAEDLFKSVYGEIISEDTPENIKAPDSRALSCQAGYIFDRPLANNFQTTKAKEMPFFRRHILRNAMENDHSVDRSFANPLQRNTVNTSLGSSTDTVTFSRPNENNSHVAKNSHQANPWMLTRSRCITLPRENLQSYAANSHLLTPICEDDRFPPDTGLINRGRRNSIQGNQSYPNPLSVQVPDTKFIKYDKSLDHVRKSHMSELGNLTQKSPSKGTIQNRELGGLGCLDAWLRNFRDPKIQPTQENQQSGILQDGEVGEDGLIELVIAGRFGEESSDGPRSYNQKIYSQGPPPRASPNASDVDRESTLIEMHIDDIAPVTCSKLDNNQNGRICEPASRHLSSASQEMVADALDFEYRKRAAIQAQRIMERQQVSSQTAFFSSNGVSRTQTSQSSPYQNRYLRANADLAQQEPDLLRHETAFSLCKTEQHPRTYYKRIRNIVPQNAAISTGLKWKRLLTNQFPLDTTPEAYRLDGFIVTWTSADNEMSIPPKALSETDEYIRTGLVPPSSAFLEVQPTEIAQWTARLLTLIQEQYQSENPGEGIAQLVFDEISTSHATALP